MKKPHFLFFVFWMAAPGLARSEGLSLYEQKIRFEEKVVSQIEENLSPLVSPDVYSITAVADLSIVRKRQTEQVNEPGRAENGNTELLPGFDSEASPAPIKLQNSSVVYEEVAELKALTLNLFLRKNISQESEKVISDYLQNHWIDLYPEVTLVKKKIDFPSRPLIKKWPEALALAAVLFLLFLLLKRKKEMSLQFDRQPSFGAGAAPASVAQNDEDISLTKQVFIQEVVASPLVARRFLANLNAEGRQVVLASFADSFILGFLKQWIKETDGGIPPDPSKLKNIVLELKEYKAMREKFSGMTFGFLGNLMPEELVELVSGEPTASLSILAPYLETDQLNALLQTLPPENQSLLLEALDDETKKDSSSLEKKLRVRYDLLTEQILLSRHSSEDLLGMILDHSSHGAVLAKQMISKKPELKESLQKYLWDFEYFLSLDSKVRKKILGEVDNETLMKIIQGADGAGQGKIREALSDDRNRVVEGLFKSMGKTYDIGAIKGAKTSLVRLMRQMMAS